MGWVKVYRKLLNDSLWEACNSNRKVVMITMLLLANHKDKEIILKNGKKLKIKSGQFLTSIDNLSKKCGKGITRDVVYKALYFFEKVNFCLQERPQGGQQEGTLITIVNWALYQSEEKNDNMIGNKEDTKQTISRQQNKNVKNEKKNIHSASSESLWKLYPNKKGKVRAMKKIPKLLEEFGFKKLEDCINRYVSEVEAERSNGFKSKSYQNGDTFFNGTYVDYLDENYLDKYTLNYKQEDFEKENVKIEKIGDYEYESF